MKKKNNVNPNIYKVYQKYAKKIAALDKMQKEIIKEFLKEIEVRNIESLKKQI